MVKKRRMKWVQWLSAKHQDGRRNSAVGYNRSKWHLLLDEGYTVVCGREINISSKEVDPPLEEGADVCKVCQRRFDKG